MATAQPPGTSGTPGVSGGPGGVYRITAVPQGLTQEQAGRTRRYLLSMGLRTVLFLLAVPTHGLLRWVCIAGAVLLPYLAVIAANAGREPTRDAPPPPVTPQAVPGLPGRASAPPPGP